jgi:hypothetical protein
MAADLRMQFAEKGVPMKIVAIVLIVLGALSLAYGGITYTRREKVLDIGPIEATAERQKTIPLPPVLGGIALAGGIGLLLLGSKKKS